MLQTCIKNRLIRRGIVALALLAVLLGIPVAAAQTVGQAVAAGVERGDYATAMEGFRVHAEQGNANAQEILGLMYDFGKGVPEDDAEAVKWYRKAAEQGHALAQSSLGVMYDKGEGVLKDEAEAVRWFRLAAEQGDADAQFNLGVMHAAGKGVLKDEAEAARWYRLAAEKVHQSVAIPDGGLSDAELANLIAEMECSGPRQGHANAQLNLGLMYSIGRGVLKDSVLAHMWSNIAGANGNASARKLRDRLERDMTRAEVSRAAELARACMTSDYQDCEP